MSKVGVLTFHRASNYGAVLQTWALQRALLASGVEAEVIDYRSPFIEAHYTPTGWKTLLNPRLAGIALLRNGYMRDRRSIFEKFVREEIPMSSEQFTPENLSAANHLYAGFITGSDQVWNYQTAGFDRAYFLDFVEGTARKTAYAASIGLEQIPEEHSEEYLRLFQTMGMTTLRETSGSRLFEDITGKSAPTVLDPTLLLSAEEWAALASDGTKQGRPYVFVYLLAETKEMLDYARRLARVKNCDVVYVSQRLFRPRGMETLDSATPQDFVSLVKNASAIVTNSFHGLAFGLNFGAEVHFDYLPAPSKVNSRLEDIARRLDALDRQIIDGRLLSGENEEAVNMRRELLAAERQNSMQELTKLVESMA